MTPEIQEIIDEQGWDSDSILDILWSYVDFQCQPDAVLDHFRNAQAMENIDEEETTMELADNMEESLKVVNS